MIFLPNISSNTVPNSRMENSITGVLDASPIHPKTNNKRAIVKVYYYNFLNEVRIIYIINKSEYSESDALICVRDTILDFLKQYNFYHYYRLNKDKIIYSRNQYNVAIVRYEAHIKVTD